VWGLAGFSVQCLGVRVLGFGVWGVGVRGDGLSTSVLLLAPYACGLGLRRVRGVGGFRVRGRGFGVSMLA